MSRAAEADDDVSTRKRRDTPTDEAADDSGSERLQAAAWDDSSTASAGAASAARPPEPISAAGRAVLGSLTIDYARPDLTAPTADVARRDEISARVAARGLDARAVARSILSAERHEAPGKDKRAERATTGDTLVRAEYTARALPAVPTGVTYDRNGNMTGFKTADGKERTIGWKKEGDGKYSLDTIDIKLPSGKVHKLKHTEGQWTIDGVKTAFQYEVDSKKGTYSWKKGEDGDKTILSVKTGKEQIERPDGTCLHMEGDHATKSTRGRDGFELKKEGDTVVGITETRSGKTTNWRRLAGDVWKSDNDKDYGEGKPSLTEAGDLAFTTDDRSLVFKVGGGLATRVEDKATKAVVESGHNYTRTISADGSEREIRHVEGPWGSTIVTSESTRRNGKLEEWQRQRDEHGRYTDRWTNWRTDAEEYRKDVKLEDGVLSYKLAGKDGKLTGTEYTSRPDGSERIANAKGKWSVDMKGDQVEVKYADGHTRKYTHRDGMVKTMEILDSKGKKVNTWTRTGKDEYTDSKGEKWKARLEIDRDKFKAHDLKTGKTTERHPDGLKIDYDPKTKTAVESRHGVMTAATSEGSRREFVRGPDMKVREIHDKTAGTVLKKDGDEWKLYNAAGKRISDGYTRRGEPDISTTGKTTFATAEGTLLRHEVGKPMEKVSHNKPIERKIAGSPHLDDKEKKQFLEYLDKIETNPALSRAQKDGTRKQIERILDHGGKPPAGADKAPFDAKKEAKLALQLAWHIAHPDRDGQGRKPTCTVSAVRVSLERNSPAEFAKVMADVITTRQYVCRDKSVIKLPPEALTVSPHSGESRFPPSPGDRSELGKIADLTLANIHWQRSTRDSKGYPVAKGSMRYEEPAPKDGDDLGSKVVRYDTVDERGPGGKVTKTVKRTEQEDRPCLYGKDMMGIYSEITGKPEKDRFLLASSSYGHGPGVLSIRSKEQLHEALSKGPWPKIVELHDGVLYGGKPSDKNEAHITTIVGYDPVTKRVQVDNTHNPGKDLIGPGKGVTLDALYSAMKATHEKIQPDATKRAAAVAHRPATPTLRPAFIR